MTHVPDSRARRGIRQAEARPRSAVRRVAGSVVGAFALLLALSGCRASGSALVSVGAGLKGRTGLEATVYARGLRNASAFAFDRRGRLWVTTSAPTDHRSDGLFVVARAGARPVKVAGDLNGPLGLAWYESTLYVSSIGRVEAFGGLHGTSFTTRRTILRGPVEGASNTNLVVSPDGRLIMGVSATCDHCNSTSKWEAAVVSFRRDGSDLRIYASHVRAAYGLAYVPGTEDLLVTMNQRDDLGAETPGDWLALVRRGEDWGFPDCYGQGGAVCEGVPEPLAVLDRHAAAGSVAVVAGGLGGSGTAALVAEWETGAVERVQLSRSGSTYDGSTSTLLTGFSNPLAVATAPDGSLLVGDWGSGIVYRVVAT